MFHVKHLISSALERAAIHQGLSSGVEIDLVKLEAYLGLLTKWNKKIDLVAPCGVEDLIQRHLQDSFAAYLLIRKEVAAFKSCLDVGTGAGLPGIIFAILEPDVVFHLCEPREKRQIFLREVVESLGLENVELLRARLEELEGEYDLICSRALGIQEQFLSHSRQLLAKNGSICQLLGPSWSGQADKVVDYSLEVGGPSRKLAIWFYK